MTRFAWVAACLVLAACAEATVAPATSSAERAPDLVVPGVERPLAADGFKADPCALVPAEDRAALGLSAARASDTVSAGCDLVADGPDEFLRVSFNHGLQRLVDLCGTSAAARCDSWRMTDVDGYPAIDATSDLEERNGSCRLFLGISDAESVLLADIRVAKPRTAGCDRARRAAGVVLGTLR
ncbi:DUF3558 family protein [Actinokineospora soli]|uniref:DUF3558 family protein n=1 Tax=Actinokineospora soli TaxID=1048753 RepID=A0ABW2TVP3_9PSEU